MASESIEWFYYVESSLPGAGKFSDEPYETLGEREWFHATAWHGQIRRMESKDYLKMLPKRWLSFEKHAGGGCKQVFKNALTQSNWRRSIWASRSFIQVMQPPLDRKWSPWLWRDLPLDKWMFPMLLLQNFVRPLIKLVVSVGPLEFYGSPLFVMCLQSKWQDPKTKTIRLMVPKELPWTIPIQILED